MRVHWCREKRDDNPHCAYDRGHTQHRGIHIAYIQSTCASSRYIYNYRNMRSAEIRELYEANHVKLLIDIHICARDDVRVMYRCCNVGITTSGQNSHYNYMIPWCMNVYIHIACIHILYTSHPLRTNYMRTHVMSCGAVIVTLLNIEWRVSSIWTPHDVA